MGVCMSMEIKNDHQTIKLEKSDTAQHISLIEMDTTDCMLSNTSHVLPVSSETLSQEEPVFLPKRIPILIQRKIKESDIYDAPIVPIVFVLGPEKSDLISNFNRLTEISGRLHHVDMTAAFLEVVAIIEKQDPNVIPPPKALEVFISRILMNIENTDALLVTGYPRSMRDVVEYMARVQRIDGVIFLDPNYASIRSADSNDIASDNFITNISPVVRFFEQEEKLFRIVLDRPTIEIYHDIYDKVMLILSQTQRIQSATPSLMSTEKEKEEGACVSDSHSSRIESQGANAQFKRSQSPSQKPNILNKDVEDALSLLQSGSIMMRINSGKK